MLQLGRPALVGAVLLDAVLLGARLHVWGGDAVRERRPEAVSLVFVKAYAVHIRHEAAVCAPALERKILQTHNLRFTPMAALEVTKTKEYCF